MPPYAEEAKRARIELDNFGYQADELDDPHISRGALLIVARGLRRDVTDLRREKQEQAIRLDEECKRSRQLGDELINHATRTAVAETKIENFQQQLQDANAIQNGRTLGGVLLGFVTIALSVKSLLAAIIILACLTTSCGMLSGGAWFFDQLLKKKVSYERLLLLFTLFSFAVSNVGLTQIIAMKYGTVPVVRATGGLADTVFDANHAHKPYEERTGFTFNDFNEAGLESAMGRAIGLWYRYPRYFHQLRLNAMRQDYSWEQSGGHYLNIYHHIRA